MIATVPSIVIPDAAGEDHRTVYLFVVQLVGALLSLACAFHLSPDYVAPAPRWLTGMRWAIGIVLGVTVTTFCLTPVCIRALNNICTTAFGEQTMKLSRMIALYAIADALGLWVCIHATAGSINSPYVAFLFTIVPVTITLGESARRILIWLALCLFIYLFELAIYSPTQVKDISWLRAWFGISTSVCATFPVAIYALQRRRNTYANHASP